LPEANKGAWSRTVRDSGPYLGLGITLAVTVLAGLGVGHWIDGRWGTDPLFLILGGSLGVAAALIYFVRTLSTFTKKTFTKNKTGSKRDSR
jgi:ATP synthase protein I